MAFGARDTAGQSTVEWIGLVLLVACLFTAAAAAEGRVPGTALIHSVSRSVLCAVSLASSCAARGSLEAAYGDEVAGQVRAWAPTLRYGRDMLGLPVDFRTCRSPYCADPGGEGEVTESSAGEPVTLFTRVVDCRAGSGSGDCQDAEGLFVQYWAYYPESASLRGAPVLEEKGYHRHDWESTQIRIGPDGEVEQRASSHAGYGHTRSAANWGSDLGWGFARDLAEAVGMREPGGWGEATGEYLIAGGSHAGNVEDGGGEYPSWTPARAVRLVPLEEIRGGPLVRPADFDPITPPWSKRVWKEPEAIGTG